MTPEVFTAAIDEAHRHGLLVNARATTLADQKDVVRAVPMCSCTSFRTRRSMTSCSNWYGRKPYWATVIGLGDRTDVCEPDPFFEESLPAALVASIRATKEPKPLAPSCGPPSPNAAEDRLAFPFEAQILGRSLVSCRTVWDWCRDGPGWAWSGRRDRRPSEADRDRRVG
jgi:hypothetical protein